MCHKAQTLAQMNAKLEAEILNVREDLFNQISTMKSSKDENDKLILEIHKEKVNCIFMSRENKLTGRIYRFVPCLICDLIWFGSV